MLENPYKRKIRMILAAKGMSMNEFIQKTGFSSAYIYLLIYGKRTSPRAQAIIEEVLEAEIFEKEAQGDQ